MCVCVYLLPVIGLFVHVFEWKGIRWEFQYKMYICLPFIVLLLLLLFFSEWILGYICCTCLNPHFNITNKENHFNFRIRSCITNLKRWCMHNVHTCSPFHLFARQCCYDLLIIKCDFIRIFSCSFYLNFFLLLIILFDWDYETYGPTQNTMVIWMVLAMNGD